MKDKIGVHDYLIRRVMKIITNYDEYEDAAVADDEKYDELMIL